ncbi:GrpE nucleotide exchange factor [Infundibulicybe gibba]|nr:GrpE nucleotide exchange factor [Infundibulicybe gibba]
MSSRALARPANLARPMVMTPRRHYSEKAPEAESSEQAAKKEEKPSNPEAEKLKAKEAEVVDLTSRLRYLQADFLNLQRNSAREKEQTRDFAITRFASDLLETVDVLALALKSVPTSVVGPEPAEPTAESSTSPPSETSSPTQKTPLAYLQELHTGVEMTHRLLLQTLFKYHVKPFDPTGDKFDPNRHEALYQAPIPGKEPGSVIDCQKIGYTIKDRVLRAAQVGVAQDTS